MDTMLLCVFMTRYRGAEALDQLDLVCLGLPVTFATSINWHLSTTQRAL